MTKHYTDRQMLDYVADRLHYTAKQLAEWMAADGIEPEGASDVAEVYKEPTQEHVKELDAMLFRHGIDFAMSGSCTPDVRAIEQLWLSLVDVMKVKK